MDERGFAAVVGHKDVIQHIKNASVYGRVSHAYLFSGEPGSGKKLISSLFATLLECRKSSENPCFACESCRKAVNMNHPDIIRPSGSVPMRANTRFISSTRLKK